MAHSLLPLLFVTMLFEAAVLTVYRMGGLHFQCSVHQRRCSRARINHSSIRRPRLLLEVRTSLVYVQLNSQLIISTAVSSSGGPSTVPGIHAGNGRADPATVEVSQARTLNPPTAFSPPAQSGGRAEMVMHSPQSLHTDPDSMSGSNQRRRAAF